MTVNTLAAAIETMVNTPSIRHKAAHISEQLRAENGIAAAVQFVETVAARW